MYKMAVTKVVLKSQFKHPFFRDFCQLSNALPFINPFLFN
uniref:Uncharacterized protein n=1 Tax=Vibrio tasmaniensis TaxID=212663 RepID=A0A0H3ZJ96_9VIBR|nr:hypothetical protein [Vibrio tasmaniensis]